MLEFLRITLGLLVGACLGWSASAYWHGLSISPWSAADSAQSAVATAVSATQGIDAGSRATAAAKERVRVVVKTVEVDRACPPGRGAVSDDVADRLRSVLSPSSSPGAASVRSSSATAVRAPTN